MDVEELRLIISAETGKFKAKLKEATRDFKDFGKNAKETNIDTESAIKNSNNRISNSVRSMVSGIKSTIGPMLAMLSVAKLIQFGNESVKVAENARASFNQLNRLLQGNNKEFMLWVRNQASNYGLSQEMAMKYGATYSNLLSGFIDNTKDLGKYTQDMLKTSAVIAGATGRSIDDVNERIRSGLLGSTEAIEDLGINVNIATLKTSDAFKKFSNGMDWEKLDFQTQQYIRMMAIMGQANQKFGNSVPLNPIMMFQMSLSNLKLALGQALLPIINVVLPILTIFIQAVTKVVSFIAQVVSVLTGFTGMNQSISNVGGAVADLGSDVADTTGLADDFGNAMDDTATQVDKAAKKIKGSLLGIDEINVLKIDTPDSSSPSGGRSKLPKGGISTPKLPGVGALKLPNFAGETGAQFMEISEQAKAFVGKLRVVFGPAIARFREVFKQTLEIIQSLFGFLWENAIKPFIGFLSMEVAPRALIIFSEALNIVNQVLIALKPLGMWLWENFLQPIAEWTGGIILDVLDSLIGLLKQFGEWISQNQEKVRIMAEVVAGFFLAWKLTEVMSFVAQSGGIISAINLVTKAIIGSTVAKIADKAETIALNLLYAKDFIMNIVNTAVALGKTVIQHGANAIAIAGHTIAMTAHSIAMGMATAATWAFNAAISFITSPIGIATVAIGALIAVGVLLWKNWDEIGPKLKQIWGNIKNDATYIWNTLKDFLSNLWKIIDNELQYVWKNISYFFKNNWEYITNVFNNFISWIYNGFLNNWDYATERMRSVFDSVGQGISNTVSWLRNVFGQLYYDISYIFNEVIGFINNVFAGNWSNAWQNVVNIFSYIFNGIGELVKAPLNYLIGLLNWCIGQFNSIRIDIPTVSVGGYVLYQGGSFGVPQFPYIPYLATGGVLNSKRTIVAGENGSEAIVPLERNTQWFGVMENLFKRTLDSYGYGGNNSNPTRVEIPVYVGGREITRQVIEDINDITDRTGVSPLNA